MSQGSGGDMSDQMKEFGEYIRVYARNPKNARLIVVIGLLVVAFTCSVEACIGRLDMACFPFSFCLIPLLFVGGVLGGGFLYWRIKLNALLGLPELQVAPRELTRDAVLEVQYRQEVRQAFASPGWSIRLVLRETVIYTRGTDRVTEHHEQIIASEDFQAQTFTPEMVVEGRARFQVPHMAIHSFDERSNKIQWYVKTEVGIPGWPHYYRDQCEVFVL